VILNLSADHAEEMTDLHLKAITPSWSKDDMLAHVEKDICLGFGNPLQGFIIMAHIIDQSEVLTIVTDPKARRAGIGKSLLNAGENAVRLAGSSIVFLEVAEDNENAIALYRASGYKPFGRRPACYRVRTNVREESWIVGSKRNARSADFV